MNGPHTHNHMQPERMGFASGVQQVLTSLGQLTQVRACARVCMCVHVGVLGGGWCSQLMCGASVSPFSCNS